MTLTELELVDKLIRARTSAIYEAKVHDGSDAAAKHDAAARAIMWQLEDLACVHDWKPLIPSSKLHECRNCERRRFNP